tara:strand:+ start:231 stop:407 length:177 start_codon:yes stop_codon:yes gene_type:complete
MTNLEVTAFLLERLLLLLPHRSLLLSSETNGAHARDDCALLSAFFQLRSLLYFADHIN